MTGHVVARAARLLIVEVPRVFIVASNLLCSACQQQQQRQQHPQQLHSAGSFPFFFASGGVGTLTVPVLPKPQLDYCV